MSIHIIPDTIDRNTFNDLAHHPLQSWEWGEARKKMGIDVVRIGESSNVFQMTLHPIPHTPYKVGYLPRSVLPSKEVLEFLRDYGKKHNIIFIKLEPYVKKNVEISSINYLSSMVLSSHSLFPEWTQILDLTPSEDDLLAKMKSKTRYNIRLAQKKGVTVREESNEKGFEIFSKLYFETCKRQKYYGHSHEYHKTVWETLSPSISHILIAYFENESLAAYHLFKFKDTFYYTYGGSSDQHRNLMATNLLMWEAIRLGKTLGATTFDMWGSLPPGYDEKNPWAGFTRFKEGYGTEFVQFIGSYDLIIHPFLYKLYSAVYSVREKWLTR
ncbi:MAG: peptidoglycan bridge formation glycyltransferase FemA/FemB family protein [bacterium]|nr:peptidoglycan bridge formation glycyltransferase FemA/FemB family protein [bacterium]